MASSSAKKHLFGLIVGLSAAAFSLTPYAPVLEEKGGLDVLFWLRGTRPPPPQVVTVAIDRSSSLALNATDDPARWPRDLHAAAIRRLHEAGAELIAFDIFFGDSRPAEDEILSAAVRESGKVVLADYLKLKHLQGDVYVESVEPPQTMLGKSALATAPFLLAQGAETSRFLTRHGENADQPTLPVALLQLHLLEKARAWLSPIMMADAETSAPSPSPPSFAHLARYLSVHPETLRARGFPPDLQQPLQALTDCYTDGKVRYLNHYGPAGTIPRIPYHRLMSQDLALGDSVRDKIVLIGFAENFQAGSTEGIFYSPFSPVSSLELAATALANLLENSQVSPALNSSGQFLWLLCWGYVLGLLGQARTVSTGTGLVLAASSAYMTIATVLFAEQGLWLPVAISLFWQTPLALLGCLVGNYMARSREHQKIRSVIRRFIPVDVASQLIHPEATGHWEGRLTFGVCLATDAGQYTALAEKMAPMALGELMNCYYATVFPAVTGHDGWVSDVVGDAMMAIWTGGDNTDLRRKAILAALDIRRALADFENSRSIELPIRMGLHCGDMRVGFVGATEHGEYRAVGDTVNTAARLEALNKLLGTHILLSDCLSKGVEGFVTRQLGVFLLAGKVQPVSVSELVCETPEASAGLLGMIARFEEALSLYQAGEWSNAATGFQALLEEYPQDGPTRFYLETALARAGDPGSHPPGSAIITAKAVPAHPL